MKNMLRRRLVLAGGAVLVVVGLMVAVLGGGTQRQTTSKVPDTASASTLPRQDASSAAVTAADVASTLDTSVSGAEKEQAVSPSPAVSPASASRDSTVPAPVSPVGASVSHEANAPAVATVGTPDVTPEGPGNGPKLNFGDAKRKHGVEAIQAMGDRLPEVAQYHRMQPERLKEMIEKDNDLWVTDGSELLYICEGGAGTEHADAEEATGADGGDSSFDAPYPLSQTFLLHSRPNATKTIFLDFDGHSVSNSPWENGGALKVGGFYTDINADSSKTQIQQIWAAVAEDFAPFDVDVTTEDPGSEALRKYGTGDTKWGIRAAFTQNKNLLTGNAIINAGGGGTAYYNSFNWSTDDICLIFNTGFYSGHVTASHEIGHTVGLTHMGSTPSTEYYAGHGSGSTSWGPIMGASYLGNDETVVQWSKGEYYLSNNVQDELTVITTYNGFGYRADDYGNTLGNAWPLVQTGNVFSARGVVEQDSDVDFFAFTVAGGSATIAVNPYNAAPNLDILARLCDSNGNLVQESNPAGALNATISVPLAAGTYYLSVEGTGCGTPFASTPTGFTSYGSLGQYALTITVATSVNQAPTCALTAPINGATYTAPASITLQATASDTDGTVTKVEFFNGATKLGEDTTSPYAYAWSGVAAGTYTLTAKATDNIGATATSAAVTIALTAAGATDTTDDHLGTVTAQGENGTTEGMLKAFDNSTATKWLDFANAYPSTRASWIQYAYDNGIAGQLTGYTVTSANDAPERDPADWQLLGSSDGGATWATVDSRTGVAFTARFQKQTFAVGGSPTYKAYRLNILKVANPGTAIAVQLAEIELLGEQVTSGTNRAPVANAQSVSTAEDAAMAITLTATDADGDALSYTIVAQPTHGTLSGTAPSVTYTPTANYNGADSFTFRASDGKTNSNVATVSITVTAVNDNPTVTASGSPTSGTAPLTVNFTATGADVDGDTLSYAWTFGDSTTAATQNPSHVYALAGSYTAVVTVSHGKGGTANGNVTITVTAQANRAPVANAQSVSTAEDTAEAITLAATDADGDALSYTIVALPTHGTLSGTAPSVTYTPTANYNGADSFTFRASDGKTNSNVATVSITVTAVNDAPTCALTAPANGASYTAPASVTLQATAADVDGTIAKVEFFNGATKLGEATTSPYAYAWSGVAAGAYTLTAKATDNSGAITTSAAVSITVTAAGGPVGYTWCASENQSYTFTQTVDVAYGANGYFSYKYGVSGTIVFNNATFGDPIVGTVKAGYYKVVAGNQPPTANAQNVTSAEDTAKAITLTGSDPEGSSLTYTIVANPAHGMLSGTAPSVTYTPTANYNGADSFTFKVSDGSLTSAAATVSITVTAVNDTPTCALTAPVNGASYTAPASVTLQATAADVDGTIAKVEFFNGATKLGEATTSPYAYAWSGVAAGAYTLTAKATDNSGAITTSANVAITVTTAGGTVAVVNGSFETPSVGSGYVYNPAGATWTITGAIAGNGSAWGSPAAPDGTQVCCIQTASYASQTVSFDGGSYQIAFSGAQRGYNPAGPQTVQILLDGVSLGSFKAVGTAFEAFTTALVTPSAGSHVLKIQGMNTAGDSTMFIDNVRLVSGAGLQSPWQTADIGSVGVAGAATQSAGTFTLKGSGADIWNTADAYRFVYQAAGGDCEIKVRVTGVGNTDPWAKAGVMVRETLNANSTFAMMVMTPANGASFQYRTGTGSSCGYVQSTGKTTPYWVRVVRSGNSFTGYMSPDGETWTQVGAAQTITMGTSVYIGLAVTAHNNSVVNTSTVDNVTAVP